MNMQHQYLNMDPSIKIERMMINPDYVDYADYLDYPDFCLAHPYFL